MKIKLTDEQLFECIKHFKFDDKLSWSFCAGIVKQDYGVSISPTTLKNRVTKYIEKNNIEV